MIYFFSWGVESPTKFSKKVTWQDLNFKREIAGKEGVTFLSRGRERLQLLYKKLKSEILNDKEYYKPKCLSAITKNLNRVFEGAWYLDAHYDLILLVDAGT